MGLGAGVMIQLPFVIYGMMYQADERRRVIGNTVAAYSFMERFSCILFNFYSFLF